MHIKVTLKPITILLFFLSFVSFGQEGHIEVNSNQESGSDKKTEIKEYLDSIELVIQKCVDVMPTHEEYIAKHCAA